MGRSTSTRLRRLKAFVPIIGCEMYVAPGSRHERNPDERSPYHMTVLARDYKGYQNLVKLVTISHLEGFYYRPRVDREILERSPRRADRDVRAAQAARYHY